MNNKLLILGIIVCSVLLVIIALGYYFYVFDSEPSDIDSLTAKEIFERSIKAHYNINSYSFVSVTELESALGSLELNYSGSFELDTSNMRTGDFVYLVDGSVTDSDSGQRLGAGLEIRGVDDAVYIQVTHLPLLIPVEMREAVEGKWVKFDLEEILIEASNWADVNEEFEEDIRRGLTEEQKEEVLEIVIDTNWFETLEIIRDDLIDSNQVVVLSYVIDTEEMFSALERIGEILEEDLDVSDAQINYFGEIDSLSLSGEMFIDNNSFLIRRVTIDMLMDESNSFIGAASAHSITDMDNFNESVTVQEPDEFMNLEELMEYIFQPRIEHEIDDNIQNESQMFQGNILSSVIPWIGKLFSF